MTQTILTYAGIYFVVLLVNVLQLALAAIPALKSDREFVSFTENCDKWPMLLFSLAVTFAVGKALGL